MTDPKKNNPKEEKLLDHNYDGVQELDNPLPAWWVYLFYVTIVFAAVYFVVFTFFMKSTGERADEAVKKIRSAEVAAVVQAPAPAPAAGAAPEAAPDAAAVSEAAPAGGFPDDPATMAKGKEVFTAKCLPCHGAAGEGLVGPNLTDKYWIHGKGTAEDIYQTVVNGVPDKGMISWKPLLSDAEIRAVTVYLLTFKGTNPPNPKAPQGEPVE